MLAGQNVAATMTLIYHCLTNCATMLTNNYLTMYEETLTISYIISSPLPESLASQNYSLRSRAHNRQLPEHFNHLDDSNFIIRLLYKNMY